MPLIRSQKEELVNRLADELAAARVCLLFSYRGLDSKKNLKIRDDAFVICGKIKMISNKLLSIVLKKNNFTLDLPEKQLAVAYGFVDEVSATKLLVDFAKATDSLELVGGWIDKRFVAARDLLVLSSLPGKDALRAQLLGRLIGLPQSLVQNLAYPINQLVWVVKAIELKRSN